MTESERDKTSILNFVSNECRWAATGFKIVLHLMVATGLQSQLQCSGMLQIPKCPRKIIFCEFWNTGGIILNNTPSHKKFISEDISRCNGSIEWALVHANVNFIHWDSTKVGTSFCASVFMCRRCSWLFLSFFLFWMCLIVYFWVFRGVNWGRSLYIKQKVAVKILKVWSVCLFLSVFSDRACSGSVNYWTSEPKCHGVIFLSKKYRYKCFNLILLWFKDKSKAWITLPLPRLLCRKHLEQKRIN
jgi:hypothetical protein